VEALRFNSNYRERERLETGVPVVLRLVRPRDGRLLLAGFERLSPESRYRRFFAYRKDLSPIEVELFTHCDGVDHFAIAALLEREDGVEEGVGIARFVRLGKNPVAAEAAITVIDDYQGQGLGRLLLERLLWAAAERRICEMRFSVLAENKPMLSLLRKFGAVKRGDDVEAGLGVVEVVLPVLDRACEEASLA
jgi:GNAT superfamily N-acetyltransferase